jgi:ribosomal protein S18 acetylase RimI-like enzyme
MTPPAVRTATRADEGPIVAALVLAFAADPMTRWVFGTPEQLLTYYPAFVRAFGGRAFEHGSAHYVDGYAAAALWLPPGVEPDAERMRASVPDLTEAQGEALLSLVEQMGRYHPHEPCWYLPLIGVDPLYQGQGHGSALLQHALAQCDRDRLPAYLESSTEGSARLYERHGFERMGTIQAGTSPPLVPMLRQPRPA